VGAEVSESGNGFVLRFCILPGDGLIFHCFGEECDLATSGVADQCIADGWQGDRGNRGVVVRRRELFCEEVVTAAGRCREKARQGSSGECRMVGSSGASLGHRGMLSRFMAEDLGVDDRMGCSRQHRYW
jgi:hypothetical protein